MNQKEGLGLQKIIGRVMFDLREMRKTIKEDPDLAINETYVLQGKLASANELLACGVGIREEDPPIMQKIKV
jgi:hypothetical protein